jgi:hypothetical protein
MVGVELIVGYLIAWAVRKGRLVAGRLDGEVDQALGAGLDRLHDVVAHRLGTEPALSDLEQEAAADGEDVSDRTRQRVGLAVEAAAARDEAFAAAVAQALAVLRAADPAGGGSVSARGNRTTAIGGDVNVHAETGGVAGFTIGDVHIGQPPANPPQPGRSRD